MDQVSVEGQAFHRAPQQVLLASSEINQESFREYARFRQSILTHQGSSTADDDAIINEEHRRKKNNEAAKRSRDSRRAKEDEIAIRAAFLEQENLQLKWEAARLKTETARLRAALLLLDSGCSTTAATDNDVVLPHMKKQGGNTALPPVLGNLYKL